MEIERITDLKIIRKLPNGKSVAYLIVNGKPHPISISNTIVADMKLENVCNFEFVDQLDIGVSDIVYGHMYLNGIKGKKSEDLVYIPKFSNDGNHLAYCVKETSHISVDGSNISTPITQYRMIVDNMEYGPYDIINDDFKFASNNNDWVFSAQSSNWSHMSAAFSSIWIW